MSGPWHWIVCVCVCVFVCMHACGSYTELTCIPDLGLSIDIIKVQYSALVCVCVFVCVCVCV